MHERSKELLGTLGRIGDIIGRWLPFMARPQAERDHVAEKLSDFQWVDTEDESTASRQAEAYTSRGDGLAQTVFNARPQNPFGKDF